MHSMHARTETPLVPRSAKCAQQAFLQVCLQTDMNYLTTITGVRRVPLGTQPGTWMEQEVLPGFPIVSRALQGLSFRVNWKCLTRAQHLR